MIYRYPLRNGNSMTASIHQLHPQSDIGHYLRLGHTGYRQLEMLHASGRLAIDRVVVDAAHADEQCELLDALRASETEIVLDTRVAELSTPGGHLSGARKLPWAHTERPYAISDFDHRRNLSIATQIAEFAIEHRVNVVLAPRRLLDGSQDGWLGIDIEACQTLRVELDRLGAHSIAIDYPLLSNYQVLLDGAARKALMTAIADLPFDCLWLRIANFGSDKSAPGLRKYINAARDFHSTGKPLIADGIGGLPALGIAAFGAVAGICHGVAEKERFYSRDWFHPRPSNNRGGVRKRAYFAGLDTFFDQEQAEVLLATRGAKPLLACKNTGCCPGGWKDMISNSKRHHMTQTTRRVRELARVPELRRAEHFLSRQLFSADRSARLAVRLKVEDTSIKQKLTNMSRKIDDHRRVLDELHATDRAPTRSGPVPNRATGAGLAGSATGRR